MKHENETFTDTVDLDGNEFIKCSFNKCTIVYSGGEPPSLTECSFDYVKFEFQGPAKNTVAFLKSMASPDSGLQKVVRDTFPALGAH